MFAIKPGSRVRSTELLALGPVRPSGNLVTLPLPPASSRRRQGGLAAVEFAIILPLLITLMAFPIFFSRVLTHYSVAQKAARDAAMYFATIPLSEMKDNSRALSAQDMAEEIINDEIAELRPGTGERVNVVVLCDGGPCGSRKPDEISVELRMRMYDDYFYYLTWPVVGTEGIEITSKFTMKYLGK